MELQPNTKEARQIIVSLAMFWGFLGVGSLGTIAAPVAAVLLIPAMAGGLFFYWRVYSIAARETGRRPAAFFFGPFARRSSRKEGDSFWQIGFDGWRVLFTIINPSWWGRVASGSAWKTRVVVAVLVGALMLALVGFAVGFGHAASQTY